MTSSLASFGARVMSARYLTSLLLFPFVALLVLPLSLILAVVIKILAFFCAFFMEMMMVSGSLASSMAFMMVLRWLSSSTLPVSGSVALVVPPRFFGLIVVVCICVLYFLGCRPWDHQHDAVPKVGVVRKSLLNSLAD